MVFESELEKWVAKSASGSRVHSFHMVITGLFCTVTLVTSVAREIMWHSKTFEKYSSFLPVSIFKPTDNIRVLCNTLFLCTYKYYKYYSHSRQS